MKRRARIQRHFLAVSLGAVLTLAVIADTANAAFTAIPPEAAQAQTGKTYGEWSVGWWQYALAFPAESNPLLDPTGANCGVGQGGHVFFLTSTFGGHVTRNECTVPAGKVIFIPLLASLITRDRENGHTEHSLRNYLSSIARSTKDLQVTIDGQPVPFSLDPRDTPLRALSPDGFFLITDNFGGGGATAEAVSDGFYLMIEPLSPGPHTISFGGSTRNFAAYVTYNLTVEP